tara:strand:- start:242 stop:793 length:552 start_codon:yes stop_codon:yes gene_type:complete
MGFLDNLKDSPQNSGSGGGKYMKLTQGANQFRIVGSFGEGTNIQGMIGWGEDEEGNRKPYRWRIGEEAPRKFADKIKEFYAMLVWNYSEGCLQVLELTQSKLRQELLTLARDEEWGDPRTYDLKIVRNGEGLETTYAMQPSPKKKRSDEINDAVKSTVVDMSALYRGEDPFLGELTEKEEDPF